MNWTINLEEKDKSLEMYNHPKLNEEETGNIIKWITYNKTESVLKKKKNFQQTKVREQMASQVNSTKHLKKSSHLFFSNCFKKLQSQELWGWGKRGQD